ncbi:glycosyltransferase family 4 protein [Helicobacter cappadocius]|uniref:MraY family glycosyltransferase n=1 Tax=Helicobacter cappadocius TaxID=3063998 RepID=A0AA90PXE8_9HELI|nr:MULTISPECIES: MraY family glycosyltransferase [unclassified Helicobacter]MDO7252471.1 MraY family glycosyltransferase [Helicobacter sp. faydin-H75]MDP2538338.1 MraY family glycosyltransferase [Helicobacter sp. faydin-H76]
MDFSSNDAVLQTVLVAFAISTIISAIVILASNKFHIFIDKIDTLKPQGFHSIPTPRSGGIGIFLSFFVSFLLFKEANLYFLIAIAIIFCSGLLEDFSASLSPKTRLLIQLLGSAVAVFGMDISITNLLPILALPYFLGIALGLFGIIGVCNAVNIIDGFNGLAGGISLMAFISIAIVAFILKIDFVFLSCLIGIGASIGFLVFNFPKGKIFLGDGGAYMLGFIIATLLAILTKESSGISAWFGLSIMIYPVWEVVFSIIRKKLKKQSAMSPDGKHFHMLIHKKLKSNPLTAVAIWLLNLPFMVLSVVFMQNAWMLIAICGAFVVIYSVIYTKLNKSSS